MKIFIILFFLGITSIAKASFKTSFLEVSAGLPTDITIENPDATMAYYNGIAFKTQYNYNFGKTKDQAFGLTVHYKYLNIKNTKNSTSEETGIHKGAGLGIFMKYSGFYLGANYSMFTATHQSTGGIIGLDTFDYNPIAVEISYTIPYGNSLEIGPGYSYSTGDFTSQETGLSKDSPYKEQILWLKLLFFFDKI